MSKRKLTYKDFIRYFSNSLQNKDKHAFEKQMMQDAFEEEAFDGLSKLSKDELEQDIVELKLGINQKSKNIRRIVPLWFRYAASVIILIGIGTSIFFFNNQFLKDSMLMDQISEEMEIADSIMLEAEKEIQQFVEKVDSESFRKDSSIKLAEDLIADNRKREVKKTIVVVDEDIVIEDDVMISDALEIEGDDAMEELAFFVKQEFEEEVILDETEMVAQALQGKVQGVMVEGGVSESSTLETSKRSKRNTTDKISEQDEIHTTRIITGKVIGAEDNLSIPGVSIVLEDNPTIGTTTNIDGEFALTIPDDDEELKTLIAAFVGMETREITIEGDTNILVYMESDMLEMDEVVVTAYGKKRDLYEEDVKVNAQPPGGLGVRKYKEQILEKLDYSKLSGFSGKHKIKISIDLTASGRISYILMSNSVNEIFDIEIERVIEQLGRWIPATENGQNISSTVNITLKIVIE